MYFFEQPCYVRFARVCFLCAPLSFFGCGRSDSSSATVSMPNIAGALPPSASTQSINTCDHHASHNDAQLQNNTAHQVEYYKLFLEGTTTIGTLLNTTNRPMALSEEHVRRLRTAAYAADQAQDYTQCVALLSLLLRCTNLPCYVGSSVNILMAQALKNVCGMSAAVPYYERVIEYWHHLSAPNMGDESDALTAANNLAHAAFMNGDTSASMTYSTLMYNIADKSTLPSSVRDTYKLNHIINTYQKQGHAAAETLLNNTVFDDETTRSLAQGMLADP